MDRATLSLRISSILTDLNRLTNALYAMNTTDIQRYPDNYEVLSTDAALWAEQISCRVRDYDNLELKQFLDVAASFILADDSGLLCDAYNTTELGETDCTRITIMDSVHFPEWLVEHQSALRSIVDL